MNARPIFSDPAFSGSISPEPTFSGSRPMSAPVSSRFGVGRAGGPALVTASVPASVPVPPSDDPRPILVVLHQERSSTGRVGRILRARGHALDIRRPPLGDELPARFDGHRGLVVFGGPMSANDPEPYVDAEIALLGRALDADLPTFGICLGAQMLVRALGGRVAAREDRVAEIGWYPLRATEAGRAYMPGWPSTVYQWHREGFELPDGATLLAGAEAYPNQAFSIGSALAVQFHAELTLAMMCKWTVKGAARFELPGAQPRAAHLAGRLRHDAPLLAWLGAVLDRQFGHGVHAAAARSAGAA